MADWELAQTHPSENLARLHLFSMTKQQDGREIEFQITIREAIPGAGNQSMRFFARADRQTNQNTAPFTPTGWGSTLLKALSTCMQEIHRFPYEGPWPDDGPSTS
jgi:hypothetical protein